MLKEMAALLHFLTKYPEFGWSCPRSFEEIKGEARSSNEGLKQGT